MTPTLSVEAPQERSTSPLEAAVAVSVPGGDGGVVSGPLFTGVVWSVWIWPAVSATCRRGLVDQPGEVRPVHRRRARLRDRRSEIGYSIALRGASIRGVRRIEASIIGHDVEVTPAPWLPRPLARSWRSQQGADQLMQVLVTGGTGFIGSHYMWTLRGGGYPGCAQASVTMLDKLTYAGNPANPEPVADRRGGQVRGACPPQAGGEGGPDRLLAGERAIRPVLGRVGPARFAMRGELVIRL